MQKKIGATVLAIFILAGSAFAEDVLVPGKKTVSFVELLKTTWSHIVKVL